MRERAEAVGGVSYPPRDMPTVIIVQASMAPPLFREVAIRAAVLDGSDPINVLLNMRALLVYGRQAKHWRLAQRPKKAQRQKAEKKLEAWSHSWDLFAEEWRSSALLRPAMLVAARRALEVPQDVDKAMDLLSRFGGVGAWQYIARCYRTNDPPGIKEKALSW